MIKTCISVTLNSLPRQQDEEVEMLFFKIINEFFLIAWSASTALSLTIDCNTTQRKLKF
jgi:hypothetical protein